MWVLLAASLFRTSKVFLFESMPEKVWPIIRAGFKILLFHSGILLFMIKAWIGVGIFQLPKVQIFDYIKKGEQQSEQTQWGWVMAQLLIEFAHFAVPPYLTKQTYCNMYDA